MVMAQYWRSHVISVRRFGGLPLLQFRHDEANFCGHFCRDWSGLKRCRRVETHFREAKYFMARPFDLLLIRLAAQLDGMRHMGPRVASPWFVETGCVEVL